MFKRCLMLLVMLSISLVVFAEGNQESQGLERRVETLELEVEQLKQILIEMKAMLTGSSTPMSEPPTQSGEPTIENWRRLRLNMSKDDVRLLLGEPERIENMGLFEYWEYPGGGSADFSEGRLDSWSEPYSEALLPSSSSEPEQEKAKWQDKQNWRKLRRGMSPDEVRSILGEPDKLDVDLNYDLEFWEYGDLFFVGGILRFADSGTSLISWDEPDFERGW